jgi:predicted phosphodiesterase
MFDAIQDTKTESGKPQRVLILSDAHIGAKISNFAAYRENIIELMSRYDHVVMNGDMWELFYVDKDHVKSLSELMTTLTSKGSKYWNKEFDRTGDAKSGVKNVIHGAKWFTTEFLDAFPNVKLHVVCGNHENIRRFRNEFSRIQQTHPNFEWNTEALRIGDALVTHAHLPMSGQTDKEFPIVRLREAESKGRWTDILDRLESPGYALIQYARSPFISSRIMHNQLQAWSEQKKDFMVSHNRIEQPLNMDWVKHVFFGHTHVKFDNYDRQGVLFHNTGAIVKVTSAKPDDLGILEAELNSDGTLTHVHPVKVAMDGHIRLPSAAVLQR